MTHPILTLARRAALPTLLCALFAWPASAPAAVTVGSSLPEPTGDIACGDPNGCTIVQTTLGGRPVEAPISGVITSWSTRTPDAGDDYRPRLRVLHRLPSGEYQGGPDIGPLAAGGIWVHALGARISRGDLIAVELDSGERLGVTEGGVAVNRWASFTPALSTGETRAPGHDEATPMELLVNATIEPDADGDGWPDETQDRCPEKASSHRPCRPEKITLRPSKPVLIAGETLTLTVGGSAQPWGSPTILSVHFPPQLAPRAVPAGCSIQGADVMCELRGWVGSQQIEVAALQAGTATITSEMRIDAEPWAIGAGAVTVLPAGRCAHVPASASTPGAKLVGTIAGDLMKGTSKRDHLLGGEGDDCLDGQGGPDRLDGSTGADRLRGGDGADRVTGGPGPDRLAGERGADVIHARDGLRELVRCGPGRDLARLDRRDRGIGCERIRRP
jgi:hypothetical protein